MNEKSDVQLTAKKNQHFKTQLYQWISLKSWPSAVMLSRSVPYKPWWRLNVAFCDDKLCTVETGKFQNCNTSVILIRFFSPEPFALRCVVTAVIAAVISSVEAQCLLLLLPDRLLWCSADCSVTFFFLLLPIQGTTSVAPGVSGRSCRQIQLLSSCLDVRAKLRR